METKKQIPFDESNSGKYIIVKIPRKTLQGDEVDLSTFFSDQHKYRRALSTLGFIIVFFIGIIIGSLYHERILAVKADHATWKMFTTASKIR
jgi:hypothetical protein